MELYNCLMKIVLGTLISWFIPNVVYMQLRNRAIHIQNKIGIIGYETSVNRIGIVYTTFSNTIFLIYVERIVVSNWDM